LDVKTVSLAAVFASLYAVLVIFLAPISSGPIQLRVADCLLPLAALFGWPVIWGATLGCLVGNAVGGIIAFGSLNPFDVVFGPIANFIATLVIFALKKRKLLGCILASLIIGIIVGGYLWTFAPPPDIFGMPLQPWTAMVISLSLSSLVAIALIGYILLVALGQPNVIEPIKSRGLKVYL
jgi:uncharacterized membrane protein